MPAALSTPPLDPLDALLDAVLAAPALGRAAALRAACVAHPAQAATLRRRLDTLAGLGLLDDAAPQWTRFGGFSLLARLGGGGMGVVYRARQESTGAEVALKLLRDGLARSARARARFAREAMLVARLSHPSIVPVLTSGEIDGVPFLAMPLLDGRTLAQARIDAPAPWSPTAAVRLALQLADALVHAHLHGVVHRDVKPGNVMLSRDGRALLLDFGLAFATDAAPLTRTGSVLGSFAYASPEQLEGRRVDARTDVFSLGAILYELLAGRAPFVGATTAEIVQQALACAPADLALVAPGVDAALAATVRRALQRDRSDRHPHMATLAAELRSWLARQPSNA